MRKYFLLFLALVLVFPLTACLNIEEKTAITWEKFSEEMQDEGFEIIDATDQFEEGQVDSVHIAVNDDFQIEFYVVPTEKQAKKAFAENKKVFESKKGSASSHTSIDVKNFSYYDQTSKGEFCLVSRVDNTFIYAVASDDFKKDIKEIVSDLGY